MSDRPTLRRYRITAEPYEGWSVEQRLKEPYIDNSGDLEEWTCWDDLDGDQVYEMVPASDYDALAAELAIYKGREEGKQLIVTQLEARVQELESRIEGMSELSEPDLKARVQALEAALRDARNRLRQVTEPWLGSRADIIPAAVVAIVPLLNEWQSLLRSPFSDETNSASISSKSALDRGGEHG